MTISDAERIKALEDELAGARFAAESHLNTVKLQKTIIARFTEQAPIQSAGAGLTEAQSTKIAETVMPRFDLRIYLNGDVFPMAPDSFRTALDLAAALAVPATAPTVQGGIPEDVRDALDRMCTPLDSSRLGGVTAECDARNMATIKAYIERVSSTPPAAPSLTDARPTAVMTDGLTKEEIEDIIKAINNSMSLSGGFFFPRGWNVLLDKLAGMLGNNSPAMRADPLSGEPARKEG